MIKRIEHVNITVSNIEQSCEFYRSLFGFKVQWEGKAIAEEGEVRACHVGLDDIYLSFFEAEKNGLYQSDYGVNGVNHFAFVVDKLSDYRKILADLNINIHIDEDYIPGKRIYFYDPNGVEIELVEY